MERTRELREELSELGLASVETRGGLGLIPEKDHYMPAGGISDD